MSIFIGNIDKLVDRQTMPLVSQPSQMEIFVLVGFSELGRELRRQLPVCNWRNRGNLHIMIDHGGRAYLRLAAFQSKNKISKKSRFHFSLS